MAKSIKDKIAELELKEQQLQEQAKQAAAQRKQLLARQKEQERKERTHRIAKIGGAVEAALGIDMTDEMIELFITWLNDQNARGRYFYNALGLTEEEIMTAEANKAAKRERKAKTKVPGPEDAPKPLPENSFSESMGIELTDEELGLTEY